MVIRRKVFGDVFVFFFLGIPVGMGGVVRLSRGSGLILVVRRKLKWRSCGGL